MFNKLWGISRKVLKRGVEKSGMLYEKSGDSKSVEGVESGDVHTLKTGGDVRLLDFNLESCAEY